MWYPRVFLPGIFCFYLYIFTIAVPVTALAQDPSAVVDSISCERERVTLGCLVFADMRTES